jgi:hypothetical protein
MIKEAVMESSAFSPWVWRDPAIVGRNADVTGPGADVDEEAVREVAGYHVHADDGDIGSVEAAAYDDGDAYLVVDTAPWIFGRKVLLPAGTVQRIDHDEHKVYLDLLMSQIEDSPGYDKDTFDTPEYRDEVGPYFTGLYAS